MRTNANDENERQLCAILTTEANSVVAPIDAGTMPVILTGAAAEAWLSASMENAMTMLRSAPDELLRIVATRSKSDAMYTGATLLDIL